MRASLREPGPRAAQEVALSYFDRRDLIRLNRRLRLAERAVLHELAATQGANGVAWPSHATGAAHTGLSTSGWRAALRRLQAAGMVVVVERAGERQSTNVVSLVDEALVVDTAISSGIWPAIVAAQLLTAAGVSGGDPPLPRGDTPPCHVVTPPLPRGDTKLFNEERKAEQEKEITHRPRRGTAPRPRQSTRTADEEAFGRFWTAYPRKTARQAAVKAFFALRPSAELLETMLDALAIQTRSASWLQDQGRYIPYAATWLRGERWADEALAAPGAQRPIQRSGSSPERDAQLARLNAMIPTFGGRTNQTCNHCGRPSPWRVCLGCLELDGSATDAERAEWAAIAAASHDDQGDADARPS